MRYDERGLRRREWSPAVCVCVRAWLRAWLHAWLRVYVCMCVWFVRPPQAGIHYQIVGHF